MVFNESQYAAVAQQIEKVVPFDLAWASSVAILMQRGPTLHVFGSGTLFRIADESFVITAAHVIEGKGTNNLLLLPARDKKTLPFHGPAIISPSNTTDVAALKLPSEVVDRIDPSRFLRFDSVSLDETSKDAMFAVFGFPQIMSGLQQPGPKITRFHHVAPVFEGSTTGLEHYDPDFHLLIDADINETRTADGQLMEFCYQGGFSAPFPAELGGISGGSVWRIFNHPAELAAGTAKPKLVAVENAVYHERKCIKATWWKAVVHMLWKTEPELRRALEMYRGK